MDPNNQPGQSPLPQNQPTGAMPPLPQDPGLPPVPTQPAAMPGDPNLGQAPAPMPTDPGLAPPAPVAPGGSAASAPSDPNLNNAGMAVPPSMAGNPELASSGGSAGGKKALGFVFVIGGVIALIVLVVVALRML